MVAPLSPLQQCGSIAYSLQEISMSGMPMNLRGTCPGCVVNSIFILLVVLVTHCCYVAAVVEVCVCVTVFLLYNYCVVLLVD